MANTFSSKYSKFFARHLYWKHWKRLQTIYVLEIIMLMKQKICRNPFIISKPKRLHRVHLLLINNPINSVCQRPKTARSHYN
jgi:hypothetical protein